MIIRKLGAVLLVSIVVSACGSQAPKPMYEWGSYEPALYAHFKGEGNGNNISVLEEEIQQANNKGEKVGPGVYGHLGLLYAKAGQKDNAQSAFNNEKRLYPDSAHFMNFLSQQKGVK